MKEIPLNNPKELFLPKTAVFGKRRFKDLHPPRLRIHAVHVRRGRRPLSLYSPSETKQRLQLILRIRIQPNRAFNASARVPAMNSQ